MTHNFSIVSIKDHLNDPHAIFSVKADLELAEVCVGMFRAEGVSLEDPASFRH